HLVAQCLEKRLSQCDPAVLDRVMRVDLDIPVAAQVKIHHRVLGEQRQHMVKEGNAGLNRRSTPTIDRELHQDIGFCGLTLNLAAPLLHRSGTKPESSGELKANQCHRARFSYSLAAVVELAWRFEASFSSKSAICFWTTSGLGEFFSAILK